MASDTKSLVKGKWMNQSVQKALQSALESQDEAQVGRILTSLFINSQKDSSSTPEQLVQEVQQTIQNLSGSHRDYWTNLAQQQS